MGLESPKKMVRRPVRRKVLGIVDLEGTVYVLVFFVQCGIHVPSIGSFLPSLPGVTHFCWLLTTPLSHCIPRRRLAGHPSLSPAVTPPLAVLDVATLDAEARRLDSAVDRLRGSSVVLTPSRLGRSPRLAAPSPARSRTISPR